MEAPGIEPTGTSAPIVADRRETDAEDATQDDSKPLEVSALSAGGRRPAGTGFPDPDEALKVAIVAAVWAGDTGRARALLDVLDVKPSAVRVIPTPTNLGGDIDSRVSARYSPGDAHPRSKMR